MVDTWIEQYPPEIDVYKVPHDRMKELVNVINEKLPAIQVSYRHNIRTKKVKLLLTLYRPLHPHPFLDAIASLDLGYGSKSVRIIKLNNRYNRILNVVH